MFFDFLKSIKSIHKLPLSFPQKIEEILKLENSIGFIFTGLFGTLVINYLIYRIAKNWFEKVNEQTITIEQTRFSLKELITVFGFFLLSTIFIYHKVIAYFSSHLFAIGGDSFNHYARLKASKDILLDPNKSIFHWPGIFFPDGLTAFDGPPTLYNDLIHLILSPILSSIQIYNLIHLSTFVLGGLFGYMLIKEITKDTKTALFCGFIFVFGQQHIHAAHLWLNITHIEFIPLTIFFYLRFINKQERRLKYILGAAATMTIIGYQSLYFYFMLSLFLVLIGISIYKKNVINQRPLLFPIITSSVLMLPWLIPMLRDPTVEKSSYTPHMFFNTDLMKLISSNGQNFFFNSFEANYLYIGPLMIVLTLLGLIFVRKRPLTKLTIFFLFILSCGTFLKAGGQVYPIALPEIILTFMPAFKSLRSTDRYLLFLPLASGMMIMTLFIENLKSKNTFIIYMLVVGTLISYSTFPSLTLNPKAPEIYHHIPTQPKDDVGILEFPLNSPIYWLWRADHGHNVVYGYLFIRGKKNKFFHQLHKKVIERKKIKLKELKEKGVKYIVSHQNQGENLYAKIHGYPERVDGIYHHISDYIEASDLTRLQEVKKLGDKILYQVK